MNRKTKSGNILNYFSKTPRLEETPSSEAGKIDDPPQSPPPMFSNNKSVFDNSKSLLPGPEAKSISLIDTSSFENPPSGCMYDITDCIPSNNEKVDDHIKLHHFQNIFVPHTTYKFPLTLQNGQYRKFNLSWTEKEKYFWLVYSPKEDGAFCKYCVFFAKTSSGKGSHQNVGALVTCKFSKWKHALEYFNTHANNAYHKAAVIDGDNFVHMMANKTEDIKHCLDQVLVEQVEKNRKRIVPIIEAVILCGRQEIALRGHRDFGPIEVDKEDDMNTGNFRAILKYRAKGDENLRASLEGTGKRDKYISAPIQNQIVSCINNQLLERIVQRINDAKGFTVLADETADVAGIEQLSLCARYISADLKIREDFLQFVPVFDVTGKGLAESIIENLVKFGLDVSFLRGQGYDGAASMSGKVRGAHAFIQQDNPLAVYSHCAAHNFNLVVTDTCNIPLIRNSLGTLEMVRTFFGPPKRRQILNDVLESLTDVRARSLKRTTLTRWIERLRSAQDFKELYGCVVSALEKIQEFDNKTTSHDAMILLATITKGDFVVCSVILSELFALGESICRQLQRQDIDFAELVNIARDLKRELLAMRENVDDTFSRLFLEAKKLASSNGVEIKQPRISTKQAHRANQDTGDDVEGYYKVSVFIPFLDAFICSLQERFLTHCELFNSFNCLLPRKVEDIGVIDGLKKLHEFYASDPLVADLTTTKAELKLFHQRLSRLEQLPQNAMEALSVCDRQIYPNVFRLLQLLATLPVTTATNERSFSTLKRIKTYLRNTTSEARLNGLAMMTIHREERIDVQTVINDLSKQRNRRLPFVL